MIYTVKLSMARVWVRVLYWLWPVVPYSPIMNESRMRNEPCWKWNSGPAWAPLRATYGWIVVIGQSWWPVLPRVTVVPWRKGSVICYMNVNGIYTVFHWWKTPCFVSCNHLTEAYPKLLRINLRLFVSAMYILLYALFETAGIIDFCYLLSMDGCGLNQIHLFIWCDICCRRFEATVLGQGCIFVCLFILSLMSPLFSNRYNDFNIKDTN